jgi:RNA polymerase sigma-70 factor (family 1)
MNSLGATLDEMELLRLLQTGDEKAFATIYNHYWKKMFYVAAQKLQSLGEAEEVVQDIFMELWRRKEEIHITTCLSSYLATCVKYKVINVLAKKSRQRTFRQHAASQLTLADHSTEQTLQLEELKRQLSAYTSRLPEKCRLVFQLSREEGFSHKQIAASLGISEKTVESHLTKALRALKTSLSHILSSLIFLINIFEFCFF